MIENDLEEKDISFMLIQLYHVPLLVCKDIKLSTLLNMFHHWYKRKCEDDRTFTSQHGSGRNRNTKVSTVNITKLPEIQ